MKPIKILNKLNESMKLDGIDDFFYNKGLKIAKSICEKNKTLKCCKQVCEAVEEASGGIGECKTISLAVFKQGEPYPYMNHYVLSVIGNDGKNYIVDYTSKQFEGSVSPEDCNVSVATPHNGVWYEGEMSPKYNTVSEQINNFRNGNATGPVVIYTNIGIDQLN